VYALDHSGVRFSLPRRGWAADPFSHLHMGMDSGCAGIVFITRSKVKAEYGYDGPLADNPELAERLWSYLTSEVETYDNWCNGQVFCYGIEDENGEEIESCCGFYGFECAKQAAIEACPEPDLEGEPEI
jgi:hypothetical protein